MNKINKFLSFLRIMIRKPSMANVVINSSENAESTFKNSYPEILPLPQIAFEQLNPQVSDEVDTFLLDGSSMITDLQLLKTLALRSEVNSYLEIGTWRGESVHNVAKIIDDCTTINLSKKEIQTMNLNPKYAEQHAVLSEKNQKIKHIEANTKTFDFASLQKKYDLIFIDGDHSYEMVLNDTKKVFQNLIHPNSIVVWHDYAYNPQNIRYEVYRAILDAVGVENHQFLYHPKNTMCAVFIRDKILNSDFDEMAFPEKLFTVKISSQRFN